MRGAARSGCHRLKQFSKIDPANTNNSETPSLKDRNMQLDYKQITEELSSKIAIWRSGEDAINLLMEICVLITGKPNSSSKNFSTKPDDSGKKGKYWESSTSPLSSNRPRNMAYLAAYWLISNRGANFGVDGISFAGNYLHLDKAVMRALHRDGFVKSEIGKFVLNSDGYKMVSSVLEKYLATKETVSESIDTSGAPNIEPEIIWDTTPPGATEYVGFRANQTEGFVYVIGLSAYPGKYKIGHANDIEKRIKGLGTAVPEPFRVFSYEHFENSGKAENEIHAMLSERRVHGEWFESELQSIKDCIAKVKSTTAPLKPE